MTSSIGSLPTSSPRRILDSFPISSRCNPYAAASRPSGSIPARMLCLRDASVLASCAGVSRTSPVPRRVVMSSISFVKLAAPFSIALLPTALDTNLPPTPVTISIGIPIAASMPRRFAISPSLMSSPSIARDATSCPAPAVNPPNAAAPAISGIDAPPVSAAAPIAPAMGMADPAVSPKKSASDVPSSSTARNCPPVSCSSRYSIFCLPPISTARIFSRP